ncbi:ROK family protein [Cellulomonas iranensis]|uniref:ROK family protein n=1 Tax=Cellulomonas iranensis TaxID=76862 RepID=UPI003D7D78F4
MTPRPPTPPAHPAGAASDPSGSDRDDLRRRNLAAVLQAVHLRDGSTRADLTRETGLHRSTVRALVAELVRAGTVTEDLPAPSGGVGRPSPRVRATDATRVLTLHPELDATHGALVGLGGRVLAHARVPHEAPPRPDDVLAAARELRDRLAPTGPLRGVGVAAPGLVDRRTGTVVVAPHLGWRDVPLGPLLAAALDAPVAVDNDANCGVVAEALFGAGRGARAVVYLNGGASGIGGSAADGGVLTVGAHGFGGEIGHTLVRSDGRPCHCGADGCLETEVSRARLLAALGDVPASELEPTLARVVAAPPSTALAEIDRQLGYLGVALRTVVNVLNPERIVLGGFLAALVRTRGTAALDAHLARALPGARDDARVVTAELGADLLAVGAAQLVLRDVLADPLSTGR